MVAAVLILTGNANELRAIELITIPSDVGNAGCWTVRWRAKYVRVQLNANANVLLIVIATIVHRWNWLKSELISLTICSNLHWYYPSARCNQTWREPPPRTVRWYNPFTLNGKQSRNVYEFERGQPPEQSELALKETWLFSTNQDYVVKQRYSLPFCWRRRVLVSRF